MPPEPTPSPPQVLDPGRAPYAVPADLTLPMRFKRDSTNWDPSWISAALTLWSTVFLWLPSRNFVLCLSALALVQLITLADYYRRATLFADRIECAWAGIRFNLKFSNLRSVDIKPPVFVPGIRPAPAVITLRWAWFRLRFRVLFWQFSLFEQTLSRAVPVDKIVQIPSKQPNPNIEQLTAVAGEYPPSGATFGPGLPAWFMPVVGAVSLALPIEGLFYAVNSYRTPPFHPTEVYPVGIGSILGILGVAYLIIRVSTTKVTVSDEAVSITHAFGSGSLPWAQVTGIALPGEGNPDTFVRLYGPTASLSLSGIFRPELATALILSYAQAKAIPVRMGERAVVNPYQGG